MQEPAGPFWFVLSVAAAILCAGAGVAAWRWSRGLDREDRLLATMLPTLGVIALLLLAPPVLASPANIWNDIRLAPTAALLEGYRMYYMPGEGPMLGHIYGPVAPLAYLPALLWSTPAAAIRTGVLLTIVWLTLPAALMIRDVAGTRRVLAVGCLVLFVFLLRADVVRLVAFGIHSDTPAVALAGLACFCLTDPGRRRRTGWLAASALAAVLSTGSKQVALPVLFALPAYVWLADGRRAALRYGQLIAIFGVAAGAVVALVVDVPAMLYQTLVIPSGHDWRFGDASVVLVHTIRDLVPRAFPFAAVIGVYGLWRLGRVRRWSDVTRWVQANPWLVPVFVGVFCIPTSMLGRMKEGGSMNTLIYTIYFLIVGALLALLHAANTKTGGKGLTTVRRAATVAVTVALAIIAAQSVPRLRVLPATVRDLPQDTVASAFQFARLNPGEVYLPYHPLITLMAEQRAYHLLLETMSQQYFEYLVDGPDLSLSDADDAWFSAFLPPKLQYVLYRTEAATPMTGIRRPYQFQEHLWRYLPEMRREVPIAPGWTALVSGDTDLELQ